MNWSEVPGGFQWRTAQDEADLTAAAFFADASLDWVHLDERHDREHVQADIGAWLLKVRSGGWLSGDDYGDQKWPEVVSTVHELLPGARPWSTRQWRWLLP